jgi:hypothetical protein
MMFSNNAFQWNITFIRSVHDWEVEMVRAFTFGSTFFIEMLDKESYLSILDIHILKTPTSTLTTCILYLVHVKFV